MSVAVGTMHLENTAYRVLDRKACLGKTLSQQVLSLLNRHRTDGLSASGLCNGSKVCGRTSVGVSNCGRINIRLYQKWARYVRVKQKDLIVRLGITTPKGLVRMSIVLIPS